MTKKEQEARMHKMTDREILNTILNYPEQEHLNMTNTGRPRKFQCGKVAEDICARMKQYPHMKMTKRQRYALIGTFTDYADDRFIEFYKEPSKQNKPVVTPKEMPKYDHIMPFSLIGETKPSTQDYLNQLHPWAERLNKKLADKGIKEEVKDVSFSAHVRHKVTRAGYKYKIHIYSDEPLTNKAAKACEYYFRGFLKFQIVDNLKQNGYMRSGYAYFPPTAVIPYEDRCNETKPAKGIPMTLEELHRTSVYKAVWFSSDGEQINKGFVRDIKDDTVCLIQAEDGENYKTVNRLNAVLCPAGTIYNTKEDLMAAMAQKRQADMKEFTKAVNGITPADALSK